jgi:hypothetical protein
MRLHRSLTFIILSFVYFLFVGCSSSGGGDTPAASTDINIAGVWTITETSKSSNCEVPAPEEILVLTVTQDGTSSSIGITDSEGNTFTGTLNDHTLTWSGSYPQDAPDGTAGTTTLNPMTATIDASCNTLTGNASWTWTATEGEPYSCSGTTIFNGDREPAIGCGTTTTTGSPTGVWEGTFTELGSSFNVAAIVQGDQIRLISDSLIEASAGTISVSGGSFTASMTDYTFGEPNGETTSLTGTFTAGSAMSGIFNVSDGTSGTFSLTYDTVTDKGSSLALTAGSWTGGGLTLTVDNTGAISGTDTSSCIYQGTVSIIDAAVNIYGLSTTVSNCGTANGTYNGYAVISDTSGLTNNTLNFVLHNSSFLVVGELFK